MNKIERLKEIRTLLTNAPMECTGGGDYSPCRPVLSDDFELAKQINELYEPKQSRVSRNLFGERNTK